MAVWGAGEAFGLPSAGAGEAGSVAGQAGLDGGQVHPVLQGQVEELGAGGEAWGAHLHTALEEEREAWAALYADLLGVEGLTAVVGRPGEVRRQGVNDTGARTIQDQTELSQHAVVSLSSRYVLYLQGPLPSRVLVPGVGGHEGPVVKTLRREILGPGCQQSGACPQGADKVDGQTPSVCVGEAEAGLDVLQGADVVWPPPAGVHSPAEHQTAADVPGLCEHGENTLMLWSNTGPVLSQGHHGSCIQQTIPIGVAHSAAHAVGPPVVGTEVGWTGGSDHQVLHVPPCQVGIGLQCQGYDPSSQRGGGGRPCVGVGTLLSQVRCHLGDRGDEGREWRQ